MRRFVHLAVILSPVLAVACETQALDPHPPSTPDAGGATMDAAPAGCIATMASFTDGLRADVIASVGPAFRTSSLDVAVDGVTLEAGYGQDYAALSIGFSVGAPWFGDLAPDTSTMALSFGGWQSQSSVRDARGFHAADQLWTALAGAQETVSGSSVIRTTSGRRAACARGSAGGTVSIDCVLGGLIRADASEVACPQPPPS